MSMVTTIALQSASIQETSHEQIFEGIRQDHKMCVNNKIRESTKVINVWFDLADLSTRYHSVVAENLFTQVNLIILMRIQPHVS